VRAGIVPALRNAGHDVLLMTPGTQPVDALAQLAGLPQRATREGTRAPVLVIDQFEEASSVR
jgi:hypothetical protein